MSLHLSLPDHDQITDLLEHRRPGSVSIILATDPASDAQMERIELGNLRTAALAQLAELDLARGEVDQVAELLGELEDDEDFWAHQARGLVIYVDPDHLTTFQLPNSLTSMVKVSDRWHVKPLLRALTFPQSAYVLAISQNATRVLAVLPDGPAAEIRVPDLPRDAVDAVAVGSISGRSHYGRVAGGEGRKMRLGQFSRAVDHALRALLHGHDTPLILAAARPMDDIYRSWNTYPYLATQQIEGNVEVVSDHDLAAKARAVIDAVNAERLAKLHEQYDERTGQRRTLTDVADVARAATYGQIATLFVDIDAVVPGSVDDAGAVTFAETGEIGAYGVLDEITRRVWNAGGQVLAVRREDIPGGGDTAAILRWAV
ncbi:MAG: hypothetical protein ACOYEV_03715 [Candidatus Nanopelagicales bacterium]